MTKELLFQKAINWATYLHAQTLMGQLVGLRIDSILQHIATDKGNIGLEFGALQHAFLTAAREFGIQEKAVNFWILIEDNYQDDLQSYARIYMKENSLLPYNEVAKTDIAVYELRGCSGLFFSELPDLLISAGILHHYRL